MKKKINIPGRQGDVVLIEMASEPQGVEPTGRREGLGEPQKPTALNAVASTYGMRGEQCHPMVET